VLCGTLIEKQGISPYLVIPFVLVVGSLLGLTMGAIIHYFEIQPFIVTLAGLFLARGTCYAITTDSITIDQKTFSSWAQATARFGDYFLTAGAIVAIVVVLIGFYVLHYTRFGRNVYAIGGSKQSALLMGLPVARTTMLVYTVSGFCAALGGVLLSFYTLSGFGSLAVGMELDAIAAVVVGGTLLTGGAGTLGGTIAGVLLLQVIQNIINQIGTVTSAWQTVISGAFIALVVVAQTYLARLRRVASG
jgi:galactofuranose transport system permease protein